MASNQVKCTISLGSQKQTVYIPIPSILAGKNIQLSYTGTPKTKYVIGEPLDISGLRFFLTSSDGESVEITDPINELVISADMNQIGTQEVKISCDLGCSYSISIFEKSDYKIQSIYIQSLPDKLEYTIGESLKLDGMVVCVRYSNVDLVDILPLDQIKITGFDSSISTSRLPITVSYTFDGTEYTDRFYVSITDQEIEDESEIVSISASVDDTYYYMHEKLVKTDVNVVGTTKSGKKIKIPSSNCSFSGFDSSRVSTNQQVSVSYNPGSLRYSTTFTISIIDNRRYLIGFRIDQTPTKTVYSRGSTSVDLSGAKFSARYRLDNNDSKWIPIQKDYVTTTIGDTSQFTKPGENVYVTVHYGQLSAMYPISVCAEDEE